MIPSSQVGSLPQKVVTAHHESVPSRGRCDPNSILLLTDHGEEIKSKEDVISALKPTV